MITLAIVGLSPVPWFRWLMLLGSIGSMLLVMVGRPQLLREVADQICAWRDGMDRRGRVSASAVETKGAEERQVGSAWR